MLNEYEFPDDTPIIVGSALKALEGDDLSMELNLLRSWLKLDSYIPEPVRETDKPFLMPIEDIFSIQGRGIAVTGRIEREAVNDEMKLLA